jgi:GAF domain-containing protein
MPQDRARLAAHAETAMHGAAAACAAVSCWERDRGRLRTLVNVGTLSTGVEESPEDEVYPLDTFPATDALLRFGRLYLDPDDVASSAVLAQMGLGSQAAVPIVVEGRVWGELWVARELDTPPLTAEHLAALTRCAEAIGRLVAAAEHA